MATLPDHLSHRIRNLPEDWRPSAFDPKPFQSVIHAITQADHPEIEFRYLALITLRDEIEDIVVQVMQSRRHKELRQQIAQDGGRDQIRHTKHGRKHRPLWGKMRFTNGMHRNLSSTK
ncbi:hypothetical protein LTR20_011097 [Exophiala xenobiotica]|nr:hypothetical protein LTS13_010921 [Exophiala xenobiotica]KAK5394038.1 hypothetical protein LTR79_008251 [Exophiala xenobiotica]KAK5405133.1 hypothetical protein LTR90_011056 [Exophiala xenobiotica]KAK5452478.1 hypothetical protein LTR20_011097 [Exophiala xenobiotica]KAK5470252.1 hypothetical protein LTR26_011037 [Exophiala xenobiotica]